MLKNLQKDPPRLVFKDVLAALQQAFRTPVVSNIGGRSVVFRGRRDPHSKKRRTGYTRGARYYENAIAKRRRLNEIAAASRRYNRRAA